MSKKIRPFPSLLFHFFFSAFIADILAVGSFLVGFMYDLFSMNYFYQSAFLPFLLEKRLWFLFLLLISLISLVVPFLFLHPLWGKFLKKEIFQKVILEKALSLIPAAVSLIFFHDHIQILSFSLFILLLLFFHLLYQQGKLFYLSNFHSFNAPTLLSFFIITNLLGGFSLLLSMDVVSFPSVRWFVVLLVVLDITTFAGYLNFQKKYSALTRLTIRSIFSGYFILLFLYLVTGLILPALYIFWNLISPDSPIAIIFPLLLAGQIVKLILILKTSFALEERVYG